MERLANRYDLHTVMATGHGRTLWQGHDIVLDRLVGVLVLERGHPKAGAVRDAARRASRVEHRHLQRIVDVDEDDGRVFVVTSWSSAHPLADTLAVAPLPASEARALVADVAAALAAADAQGVHHLVLDPRDVLVGEGATTVTGLAVRAAISPPAVDEGSLTDARRLGALLYAALTGRWPGEPCAGLPPAPEVSGRPARPRQVRAGIPSSLDDITCRALGYPADGGSSLDHARDIAAALETVRTQPPPAAAEPSAGIPRGAWFGLLAVACVLAVGVALLGWTVWQDRRPSSSPTPTPSPSGVTTSSSATPGTPQPVRIASAIPFDPQGDGQENNDTANLAIDNSPTTAWTTLTYTTRDLGGLKAGVGLQLRLAHQTKVAGVDLLLVGKGSDLQVLTAIGDPTSLSGYRLATEVLGVGNELTVRFPPRVATSVLIWFTGLPATTSGYQAGIANVVVRGVPATG